MKGYEEWRELCRQASIGKAPEKLRELVRRMDDLLEERDKLRARSRYRDARIEEQCGSQIEYHAWEIIHEGERVRPFQMFDSSWRGRYTAVRDRRPPLVSRREIDVL
jgi:hypothetical protein